MKKILLIVPMLLIAMVALTEKANAQTGNQSDVNVPILTNITSIPTGQYIITIQSQQPVAATPTPPVEQNVVVTTPDPGSPAYPATPITVTGLVVGGFPTGMVYIEGSAAATITPI